MCVSARDNRVITDSAAIYLTHACTFVLTVSMLARKADQSP